MRDEIKEMLKSLYVPTGCHWFGWSPNDRNDMKQDARSEIRRR